MSAPALTLPPDAVDAALAHLGVTHTAPDPAALAALLSAYTRTVPWESASRIARAARAGAAARPRWPSEFWAEARSFGTGGTCFESNAAFISLLHALGYRAYLTVNDMGSARAVHTAIIVQLDGAKWLVDAGFPLYAPLVLDPARARTAECAFHTYTATPRNAGTYKITRDRHPQPYCFTLHDRPITDNAYWDATTEDYGPHGLFLDRVILLKVIAGSIWRFDNGAAEQVLESFAEGERTRYPLPSGPDAIAATVAARFGTDAAVLRDALDSAGRP